MISLAKQSCNQPQQLIDIVQEGNIGLVKALDRFDSTLMAMPIGAIYLAMFDLL